MPILSGKLRQAKPLFKGILWSIAGNGVLCGKRSAGSNPLSGKLCDLAVQAAHHLHGNGNLDGRS